MAITLVDYTLNISPHLEAPAGSYTRRCISTSLTLSRTPPPASPPALSSRGSERLQTRQYLSFCTVKKTRQYLYFCARKSYLSGIAAAVIKLRAALPSSLRPHTLVA